MRLMCRSGGKVCHVPHLGESSLLRRRVAPDLRLWLVELEGVMMERSRSAIFVRAARVPRSLRWNSVTEPALS